jgi:hypothetical protein
MREFLLCNRLTADTLFIAEWRLQPVRRFALGVIGFGLPLHAGGWFSWLTFAPFPKSGR